MDELKTFIAAQLDLWKAPGPAVAIVKDGEVVLREHMTPRDLLCHRPACRAMTLPVQPEYEILPYQGTTFNLKGLTGFAVEFKVAGDGHVVEAVVTQPNAVFTARRIEE